MGKVETVPTFEGFLRDDGRKGIRNIIVVAYLVECAHHVAREIGLPYRDQGVHVIGFPGCYPNDYARRMMQQLCTHPNVGGVLLVSLGCESFDRSGLERFVRESGRPSHTLVIQETGGTRATVREGRDWVEQAMVVVDEVRRVPMDMSELIVGTICGGSDASSGITANPAIGLVFDRLHRMQSIGIFEETGELIGCDAHLRRRAQTPELADEYDRVMRKAEMYYETMGHGSFAPGNAEGELTTIEEKSMGAYSKSGSAPLAGLLTPGDIPKAPGIYLLDVVPDGEVRFGFPNVNDNAEIIELIACGSHVILFSTGRGSVVGSAISPVIKICGNPETYRRLSEDMDVDAGAVLEGRATLEEVGEELFQQIVSAAEGEPTASEALGHQEFHLTYKTFEPLGPSCLPV